MKSKKFLTAGFVFIIFLGGLLYLKDIADSINSNLDSINKSVDQVKVPSIKIDYSSGQLIYVPIYSQIPFSDRQFHGLNVLLSVRNTDAQHVIEFLRIDLYDTEGHLVKQYANKPIELKPLETYEIFISQDDPSGGSGGNFYLQWTTEEQILEPYVEALLYGKDGSHTFSFNSLGRIVSKQ